MTKFPLSLTLVSTEAGETKVDVLRKIAAVSQTIGLTESKTLLFEALQAREASGNTMIAEDFALPHIESDVVKKSGIVLVRGEKVLWQGTLQAKTIFAILMKTDETTAVKQAVIRLMKCFAYEEICNSLQKNQKKKSKPSFSTNAADRNE